MNTHLAIAAMLLGLTTANPNAIQTTDSSPPAAVTADQPVPLSASDNAALAYYKVWANPLPPSLVVDNKAKNDPDWRPSPELIKLLHDYRFYAYGMIEASEKERADFGIDLAGRGALGALLPHLSEVRKSAKVMACDARRCMVEGNKDDAAERIAVIYRMARHITDVDVIDVTSLVSASLCAVADSQVDLLIATGNLSAHGKEILLVEAQRMAEPDAFRIKIAIEHMRDTFGTTLLTFCKGDDAGQQFVKYFHSWYGSTLELEQAIATFNETNLTASIDQAKQAFTDIIQCWDAPNAEQLIKDIDTRVRNGEYGVIAPYFAPANCTTKNSLQRIKIEHDRILLLLTNTATPAK